MEMNTALNTLIKTANLVHDVLVDEANEFAAERSGIFASDWEARVAEVLPGLEADMTLPDVAAEFHDLFGDRL